MDPKTGYFLQHANSTNTNMKKTVLAVIIAGILGLQYSWGQTKEELEAQKTAQNAVVSALQGQIDSVKGVISGIDGQLNQFPRWETGAFGTVGLNFNGFDDWLSRDQPNIASSTIGLAANGFANHFTPKDFWRNAININMSWVKFDDKDDPDDSNDYRESADVINLTSLYGYKLNEKFAISTLGEYRSTILSNFNNPGYLDIGVGATWTPIPNMVVVIHPLNQNFVFSSGDFEYESSLGAKVVADYTRKFFDALNWKTNLSMFQSYKSSDLSNWTWVNSLGFNIAKGLGVGLELGLRNNKQEALAAEQVTNPSTTFDSLDENPLQTYYVIGFSYNLGTN